MKNAMLFSSKTVLAMALMGGLFLSCKEKKTEKKAEESVSEVMSQPESKEPFFKLSLAQWSLHRTIRNDGMDPYKFAEKAKAWGFEGLEYVSGLYSDISKANYSEEAMAEFVKKSKAESEKHGLKNLLIMVDGQGDLATPDAAKRKAAAENHHKWVDAAAALGCHSIRVNLAGSNTPEEWVPASVDGLTQLATYAKTKNINVLVENHGGLSSNGKLLAEVMQKVGMDNCGTLPDFGNFCIERSKDGCKNEYDRYQGLTDLMPYAKAVSAKSHDFDAEGNEIHSDFDKMLDIVEDAGFSGYIGVEYEGSGLSEEAGILATRDLLLKLGGQ